MTLPDRCSVVSEVCKFPFTWRTGMETSVYNMLLCVEEIWGEVNVPKT